MDSRRLAPRIAVDGLCAIVNDNELLPASLVDLSSIGLRIELPRRVRARQTLQLEIELPGIDEIVWARGSVTFSQVSSWRGLCRAGVFIEIAAANERRMLRDYVREVRQTPLERALSALVA